MPDGYSVAAYGSMMSDKARMAAYAGALQEAVGPDSVVVDIGTGTGVFAMFACKLGARRVYAIEPSRAIQVARESARANGFSDRIAKSSAVELPEPADIVVSDMRGTLPLAGGHLSAIVDARRRLLRPGGTLIPRRDVLMAAPLESHEAYDGLIAGFRDGAFGLDMASQQHMALNSWQAIAPNDARALAAPEPWCDIDYRTIEGPNAAGRATWTLSEPGTAHGLSVWFEAVAADHIRFASGPFRKDSVYGTAFFPFLEPLRLAQGETLTVELDARLVGDRYVFRWKTETAQAHFDQSTFHASPIVIAELERQGPAHMPVLSATGVAAREALALMADGRSNDEIARRLVAGAVGGLDNVGDAPHVVGKLASEYGV